MDLKAKTRPRNHHHEIEQNVEHPTHELQKPSCGKRCFVCFPRTPMYKEISQTCDPTLKLIRPGQQHAAVPVDQLEKHNPETEESVDQSPQSDRAEFKVSKSRELHKRIFSKCCSMRCTLRSIELSEPTLKSIRSANHAGAPPRHSDVHRSSPNLWSMLCYIIC